MPNETIAAISTPPGEGAISLVRLSGPDALRIAATRLRDATGGEIQTWTPRQSRLVDILGKDGETLDRGMAVYFEGPRSHTGENIVEIFCHGGPLLTRRVLESMLAAGARAAGPGEFTERAFLNGKLDLTQAEAVMDLIQARSDLALRAAREQLDGALGSGIKRLRETLIGVLAHVEAHIDFPDEGIDPETGAAIRKRMGEVAEEIASLIGTSDQGRILREGLRTALCGMPNAGKSSLLNALAGHERSIVHDLPGTTRDTIDEWVRIGGVPVRLIDTAGIRESEHPVELEGIARARREMSDADLVLQVCDSTLPPPKIWEGQAERRIVVLNKTDLSPHPDWAHTQAPALGTVRISCLTGAGIPDLRVAVEAFASKGGALWGGSLIAVSARHRACLERSAVSMAHALAAFDDGATPEFYASDLRSALRSLGEILGHLDSEAILDQIFSSFCIGK